jgi:hypothetical protein
MAATLTSNGVAFSDGSTINGTTANTIGCYVFGMILNNTYGVVYNVTYGSTYAAGAGTGQVQASARLGLVWGWAGQYSSNQLAGTWRYMGSSGAIPAANDCLGGPGFAQAVFVRTA